MATKNAPKKSGGNSNTAKNGSQQKKVSSGFRLQAASIIMFASAVLMMCFICIASKDAWLWNGVHTFLLGLFGVLAYAWPIYLGIISVLFAMDKLKGSAVAKVVFSGVSLILISSLICIFSIESKGFSYGQYIAEAYKIGGAIKGGGVLGSVFSYLLDSSCGSVGASIILFTLIFVFVMLLTGTTLVAFFKALYITFAKPVKKIGESAEAAYNERKERKNSAQDSVEVSDKEKLNVDISVDDIPEKRNFVETDLKDKQRKVIETYRDESIEPEAEDDSVESINIEEAVAAVQKEINATKEKNDVKTRKTREASSALQNSSGIVIKSEGYAYPPIDLLCEPVFETSSNIKNDLGATAQHLVETLRSFGVETEIGDISRGPAVTRYELKPCAGVRISKITNLADDIALSLAASGVRIEAPIPNKSAVGIEVPNKSTSIVTVREIIDSTSFKSSKSKLTIALGKDISGSVIVGDIAKFPHVLIAGATGSGKSVCINTILMSLLYKSTPDEVKLLLIDPKKVELGIYNGIPQLLVPVVTDPRKAAGALAWAVGEMEKRYKMFADRGVRDINGYNKFAEESGEVEKMPRIVIIIDELADLMMTAQNEVEDAIVRISQLARAAGMHLVIATQRPSVNVVTGLIKANVPSRIAFAVASQIDSRTILDSSGAEKLLGRGDMLFFPVGASKSTRVQGCFVSDEEVESVVNFVKNSASAEHNYDDEVMAEIERQAVIESKKKPTEAAEESEDTDSMFEQAVDVVLEAGQASTSLLQRRLKLGYARAARIVDQMEQKGIVGQFEGAKPRQILITKAQWLEKKAGSSDDIPDYVDQELDI